MPSPLTVTGNTNRIAQTGQVNDRSRASMAPISSSTGVASVQEVPPAWPRAAPAVTRVASSFGADAFAGLRTSPARCLKFFYCELRCSNL